ncbi:hypothetical protein [Sulfurimonas sp.]|uniref:hypothetical protein n=1 Tax=Sulfurimonas sp. TaxID=2022749 RepID=UPI0025FD32C5|nr:hypothetical protein [Sulfurimonas sp.]MCK9473672.1 hypothetical protein [Sulfurimonas sp.]
MKKIILGTLVVASVLFSSEKVVEVKSMFDLNKVKSGEMKDFLVAVESLSSEAAAVVKDYHEAKTCTNEFYNKVAVKDLQEFFSENHAFSALKTIGNKKSKYAYAQIINDYKFMNCGLGKSLAVEEAVESLKEEIK